MEQSRKMTNALLLQNILAEYFCQREKILLLLMPFLEQSSSFTGMHPIPKGDILYLFSGVLLALVLTVVYKTFVQYVFPDQIMGVANFWILVGEKCFRAKRGKIFLTTPSFLVGHAFLKLFLLKLSK